MNSKARVLAPAIVMIAGLTLATPAAADQVVYFVNGKAMTVKKVEKGDRITILEVDGGGRIGIPSEQIDRIEDLVLSNPAPAVAAPPSPLLPAGGIGPQAQPASTVTTTAATGVAAPPPTAAAGAAVGPMIGGKLTQPGGGLAGLQPLAVGGTEADGPMKATAAAAPPAPAARSNAQMTGPGIPPPRRFNSRGNPYTRMRPPSVNYAMPGQAGAAAAAAAGAKPATAAKDTAAPPPPPPAPETAVADPAPETADPEPEGEGDADAPAEPPAEEPPADDGSPEN